MIRLTRKRRDKYVSKKAVDISYHNGIINFELLKNAVDYVIIRCGYGQDMASQDDKQWNRNVGECERLGIPYGVYFYSYAKTKANIEGEINHCLRLLKGHTPTLPVFLTVKKKERNTLLNTTQSAFAMPC